LNGSAHFAAVLPPRGRLPQLALAIVMLLAGCGNEAAARDRFVLKKDPASRYGFKHAQERASGQWVHLHCELRVSLARELPDPISTPDTGDLISFTRYNPGSMGSAGIVPADFVERDGYRVWLYREVAGESDLSGSAGLSVQARWPLQEGGEPRFEPLESFALPGLNTMQPYVWTAWRRADELREGGFAGWEKTQGLESEGSAPAGHPYELRCRPVLTDHLYVDIESEDANIARPDPSAGTSP